MVRQVFQFRLQRLFRNVHHLEAFTGPPTSVQAVLTSSRALRRHLGAVMKRCWVIRVEPSCGGLQLILDCLGAYINRVAVGPVTS